MISGTFQIILSRSESCRDLAVHGEMDPALWTGGPPPPPDRWRRRARCPRTTCRFPRASCLAFMRLCWSRRVMSRPDGIAIDMVQRTFDRDVHAAGLHGHHQLDLVLIILGQGRIGTGLAILHDHVAMLGEEERQFALVIAQLPHMGEIVAPHAIDAAHRECWLLPLIGSENRFRYQETPDSPIAPQLRRPRWHRPPSARHRPENPAS